MNLKRLAVSVLSVFPILVQWPESKAAPVMEPRVLAALIKLAPPDAPHEKIPGWDETPDERRARYISIAADIAHVASQQCSTEACVLDAAAHLVGVAWHESGFAPDVDIGPCYLGKDGKGSRCDGGLAVSLWQIRTGGEERAQVAASRRTAAALAARHIRRSLGACRALPTPLRLSAYAGGRCTATGRAARASEELMASVDRARQAMVTQ